jgi:MFS family permease
LRNLEPARFALVVIFAINLLNYFDRTLFGALAEPIRKEWTLSDSQVGWLATAFILLYAVVGVPLGRLSDRWSRPGILSAGVAVWSLLTATSGLAWNYAALFAARLGVGIGEASCAPASNSLIGDFYPAKARARAVSFFMMGLPIGNFASVFVGGWLASLYGWRTVFYLSCIPGLMLAILALRISEPPRGAAETASAAGRLPEGSPYWFVLRIPTMSWIIISGIFLNFNTYTLGTFLPAFLSRYHRLNLKDANSIAAIVFGAVGVLGLLLGGWGADYARKRRPNGRLLLGSMTLLVAAPSMYWALEQAPGRLVVFSVLMGFGVMLTYVYYSTVFPAIQDIVPPSLRATGMALYFFAMYLLGGSLGPVLTGKLSDYFTRSAMLSTGTTSITESFRATGLHSAMYVIPLCSLIVAVVLFIAACFVAKDMKNLARWMDQA